ncbi:helix-turn-helix domain-containing protein [Trichothermofontia sichuanensis B231]|uniref:helix-turn-helix domain-containing protein n=1 Tax=Trichothermofontia sichuanensis TaxID=3045816 RepID=UPI0022469469|nr:helix-turn-helix domain-containing protein [Trichothermofontia sichuanensis]UZQ56058.1 helix-turn-helix domain-containing protein [Trichothermofontia sichuanensis B231]
MAGPIADFTPQLRRQMQVVGIPSFAALARLAGVSRGQIRRLRQGRVGEMPLAVLVCLSRSLQMSLIAFLETFTPPAMQVDWSGDEGVSQSETVVGLVARLAAYEREYGILQAQLAQQQRSLVTQFQRDSLDILEPWLRSWPKAEAAVANKPDLPAERLLRLAQPIKQLLHHWGVVEIGPIGAIVPFDPQLHQIQGGTVPLGEWVEVVGVGYRQGDRLLWRAEVKLATRQP